MASRATYQEKRVPTQKEAVTGSTKHTGCLGNSPIGLTTNDWNSQAKIKYLII
jgi:hypothetical protein